MDVTLQSDEELAAKLQSGDRDAFTILFNRYEKKILRYGQRFLYSYEDLEDAVQEVFIKAYKNIQSFTVSRKFSTWLYRVAHNTFINVIKKKGREPLSFFDFDILVQLPTKPLPSIQEEFIRDEDKSLVEKHLTELSPKYREPLILYYLEELDYKEISEILHLPTSTVGVRLGRAKQALKKLIQKSDASYVK
jgi:RNA polymerase sigma-70 factor (ECF subfamily)